MLAVFATVLCGAGATRTARAAGWNITYIVNGQNNSSTSTPATTPWRPTNGTPYGGRGYGGIANGDPGGTANATSPINSSGGYNAGAASTSGNVTVVFDWSTSSPVPSVLSFSIKSRAWVATGAYSPIKVAADTGSDTQVFTPSTGTGITIYTNITPTDYVGNLSADATKFISIATNGRTHIEWKSPTLSASASFGGLIGRAPSMSPISADANTDLHADIQTRGVVISSDVEPSYSKWVAPLPPVPNPLPTWCYLKDANGNLIKDANGNYSMDLGAGHEVLWADTNNGVYAVKDQGKSDGSMTVDSAATGTMGQYSDPQNGAVTTIFWYGGATFYANYSGFTNPTFDWGLGPTGSISTSSVFTVVDYEQHNLSGPPGLKLGHGTAPSPTSIPVSLVVTDSATGLKSPAATYQVNWHAPLENRKFLVNLQTIYDYDTGASNWVPMNTPITVTTQPANIIWSLLGGGTAIGSASGSVWVEGELGPIIDLALTSANYVVTTVAPGPVVTTPTFSYGDYADAINREEDIQTGAAPSTNYPRVGGLLPSELADAAASLTDAGHVTNDTFYSSISGKIQGKIVVARPQTTDQWGGDSYNHNGFANTTRYVIQAEQAPIYVSQVSFNGVTQMMSPPTKS